MTEALRNAQALESRLRLDAMSLDADLAVLAAGLTPAPTDEELGIPPWKPLDLDPISDPF